MKRGFSHPERAAGEQARRIHPTAFFFLVLLLAPGAFAAELTIHTAHRVIDLNPAGFPCNGRSYGAMPVVDDAGNVDTIYSAGGVVGNYCQGGLDSPDRFGDRIWRHVRNGDGTWSGAPVIGREAFPWLSSAHPEWYVSHLASPAVVRIGGRWFMAFVASVSDPNLCAAEHGSPTACGSCTLPWSHFAVMWAVSDDDITWHVRDGGGDNANPALAAALLWREPSSDDATAPSNYKSLARVSMVTGTDNGKTYFYLLGTFWGKSLPKETLARIPYDAADPYGLGGDAEVLRYVAQDNYTWEACPHGRLPDWLDTQTAYSIVNGFSGASTSSVFPITGRPGYRYAALGVANRSEVIAYFKNITAYLARNSVIVYSLSNDLIHWTAQQTLRSGVTHFADGLGYATSVIDPIAVENPAGYLHLYLTTGDANGDGVADCAPSPDFGATTTYAGTGIFEAPLAWEELSYTTITATSPAPAVTAETGRFHITVASADGTLPSGVAWAEDLDGNVPSVAIANVINGEGDLHLTMSGLRIHNIAIGFNTLGPWTLSSTNLQQLVISTHRRATGH